jgi:peptidoglycan/LPS O-acetylase OafA/YrhL
MEQKSGLAGVEILRFLCALAVLLNHYQLFLFSGAYDFSVAGPIRHTFPMYTVFSPAYNYGYWAVEVFWVLSGFIFYRQYGDLVGSGKIDFSKFALRRFSRLYPLHFVTLVIVAFLQKIYISIHGQTFIYPISEASFGYQLLFASNWFPWEHTSFNGPVWSISVEILVYASFFCIVRTLGPNFITAAISAGASWFLLKSGFADTFLDANVFSCGIYFFAGGTAQRLGTNRIALPLAGCVGLFTLTLIMSHIWDVNNKSVLILAISSVVFFSRLDETGAAPIVRRFSFLGNATYSSYLIHFPLQLAVVTMIDTFHVDRSWLLSPSVFVAYFTTIGTMSLVAYHWFERPTQDWIRKKLTRLVSNSPRRL